MTLLADRRGAVLVVALFASSLLIGVLYHLLGVGHAIRHGDWFRDAADGGAFAAAVIEARAFNLIALLNMVKLAVVAISVALQAVIIAAAETIAWIKASHWRRIVYGWTIPFLAAIEVQAVTTYTSRQQTYQQILDAADKAQDALQKQLPRFAELHAERIARTYEPVRAAFLAPVRDLPVEKDSALEFCERVFPYAKSITDEAFASVPASHPRGHARGTARDLVTPLCLATGVQSRRIASDAALGSEAFQLRLFAAGEPIRDNEESGVRVATWRRDEASGLTGRLRRELSRIGVAQAEAYFDGDASQSELLWRMSWKARFRRVRTPDGFAAFTRACAARGAGLSCAEVAQALQSGEALIIH